MTGIQSETPTGITGSVDAKPKFSGELRNRYKKVQSYVRRALYGVDDRKERKIKRNAAFVAADSLMQEVTPIIEQSKIDHLTQLNTKDGFTEILTLETAKAKLSGEKLMVIFIDLNKFKPVNDKLGHDVGDKVIGQFGELIKKSMRPTDVAGRVEEESEDEEITNGHAGRFGGDEFVVLLKDADKIAAESFFKRLSAKLPSMPIYKSLMDNGLSVTMSAGATEVDLDNPSNSIKSADTEMYKAKAISDKNPNTNQLSTGGQQPII